MTIDVQDRWLRSQRPQVRFVVSLGDRRRPRLAKHQIVCCCWSGGRALKSRLNLSDAAGQMLGNYQTVRRARKGGVCTFDMNDFRNRGNFAPGWLDLTQMGKCLRFGCEDDYTAGYSFGT